MCGRNVTTRTNEGVQFRYATYIFATSMEGPTYAGNLAASSISCHTIFLNTMHSGLRCGSACDVDSMSETDPGTGSRGRDPDTGAAERTGSRHGPPGGPVVQSTALRAAKPPAKTVAGEGGTQDYHERGPLSTPKMWARLTTPADSRQIRLTRREALIPALRKTLAARAHVGKPPRAWLRWRARRNGFPRHAGRACP